MSLPKPVRLLITLACGTTGALLAAAAHVPLAFMIGAMIATTAAALTKVPVWLPPRLRVVFIAIIGVMLGSGFSPDLFARTSEWGLSLLLLLPFLAITTATGCWLLIKITRTDPVTAYFGAVPGGLVDMVMIGGALGGDERRLALLHTLRVLLVVMIIPIWFRLSTGYISPGLAIDLSYRPPLKDGLILLGCAAAGVPLGTLLRLPAPPIVGPMLLSAIAHLSGLTQSAPPALIVAIAQIVVGAALGTKFAGAEIMTVVRSLRTSLWLTPLMLIQALGAALIVSSAAGMPLSTVMLAYAPGGLAEMSLIAVYLGAETAFVAAHHIIRISLVVILAPLAFRFFRKPEG